MVVVAGQVRLIVGRAVVLFGSAVVVVRGIENGLEVAPFFLLYITVR